MGFWRRLFGIAEPEEPEVVERHAYAVALDNEWDRYLKWRDAQVCVNCNAPFSTDKPNGWITETQCRDCYSKHGFGGKTRADYLRETGNIHL